MAHTDMVSMKRMQTTDKEKVNENSSGKKLCAYNWLWLFKVEKIRNETNRLNQPQAHSMISTRENRYWMFNLAAQMESTQFQVSGTSAKCAWSIQEHFFAGNFTPNKTFGLFVDTIFEYEHLLLNQLNQRNYMEACGGF